MEPALSLVVTSISEPNSTLQALAAGCRAHGYPFYLIGDRASPTDFQLEGCEYYDLDRQVKTGFATARACPERHYARKNLGYLLAAGSGAPVILETDDDNVPEPEFWKPRARQRRVPAFAGAGWINVYSYFTGTLIWPRGLPLDAAGTPAPPLDSPSVETDCPIQQGLADGDPDVDAINRMLFPLPVTFQSGVAVALGTGSWCPFNSQNTAWWPEAWPLLYLPAYCSFRMTDIWRSLIAQRVAWANGWSVLFHSPNVRQCRNEHDLIKDFQDEVPGHLLNRKIAEILAGLELAAGTGQVAANMRICYRALTGAGIMDPRELNLLDSWLEDLAGVTGSRAAD